MKITTEMEHMAKKIKKIVASPLNVVSNLHISVPTDLWGQVMLYSLFDG